MVLQLKAKGFSTPEFCQHLAISVAGAEKRTVNIAITAVGMDYRGMPVIHMETRRKKYAMKLPLDARPVKLFLVARLFGESAEASRCFKVFLESSLKAPKLYPSTSPFLHSGWRENPTAAVSGTGALRESCL